MRTAATIKRKLSDGLLQDNNYFEKHTFNPAKVSPQRLSGPGI